MSHQHSLSHSRPRSPNPVSRPTTPLRPSSRSSFRASQSTSHYPNGHDPTAGPSALDALEPQFTELSDSMADLEANFMHLQLMHESLGRFAESFATFLYGLEMRAFVVDFPEAPMPESIKRWQKMQRRKEGMDVSTILERHQGSGVGDETSVGDASYASMKATPRRKSTFGGGGATLSTPGTGKSSTPSVRGGGARGGASAGRARASGLPRGRGRGGRGG